MALKKIIISSIILLSFCKLSFAQSKDSITVNYFLLEDCKICQYYTPIMRQLHETYKSDHITFIGYFPNRFSSENDIKIFKEKYNIPFDLKKEFFQTKTQKYKVTVTPEVVVINETNGDVIYQGRIDNSYQKLGKRRRVITQHDLKDVLESLSNHDYRVVQKTKAIGCLITLEN